MADIVNALVNGDNENGTQMQALGLSTRTPFSFGLLIRNYALRIL